MTDMSDPYEGLEVHERPPCKGSYRYPRHPEDPFPEMNEIVHVEDHDGQLMVKVEDKDLRTIDVVPWQTFKGKKWYGPFRPGGTATFRFSDSGTSKEIKELFHYKPGQRVENIKTKVVGVVKDGIRRQAPDRQGGSYGESYEVKVDDGSIETWQLAEMKLESDPDDPSGTQIWRRPKGGSEQD